MTTDRHEALDVAGVELAALLERARPSTEELVARSRDRLARRTGRTYSPVPVANERPRA